MNDRLYSLSVKREFTSEHFLTGGDWGAENLRHAHLYGLEVEIGGRELDRHGFLIDIVELAALLDALVRQFSGKVLNDAPEFAGHNPSLERFCLTVHGLLASKLRDRRLKTLTVRLAEDRIAVAAYRADI